MHEAEAYSAMPDYMKKFLRDQYQENRPQSILARRPSKTSHLFQESNNEQSLLASSIFDDPKKRGLKKQSLHILFLKVNIIPQQKPQAQPQQEIHSALIKAHLKTLL